MTAKKKSSTAKTVDTTNVPSTANPAQVDQDLAKADDLSPASDVPASGALVEPEISERIDTSHPAVDDEPRKGVSKESNQIDFNDPTISQEEAVERNLKGEG